MLDMHIGMEVSVVILTHLQGGTPSNTSPLPLRNNESPRYQTSAQKKQEELSSLCVLTKIEYTEFYCLCGSVTLWFPTGIIKVFNDSKVYVTTVYLCEC